MGDRVLFQVVGREGVGPVIYSHWGGSDAPRVVRELVKRMGTRLPDVAYTSARLVQIAIGDDDGNLSFGIQNADAKLGADDSHGDAGVILIDADNGGRCECLGGYLKTGPDGFPVER